MFESIFVGPYTTACEGGGGRERRRGERVYMRECGRGEMRRCVGGVRQDGEDGEGEGQRRDEEKMFDGGAR